MRHRFRRWGIVLRKLLRRIVFSRRSANSIAWGVALGVFIGFTPTAGLQMIIAAFLATLFGVSRLAAILPVWISNPFTLAPIYYFNFRVGALFLPAARAARVREHFAVMAERVSEVTISDFVATMGAALGEMGRLGFDVLVPLVVGSVIVGTVAAATSYPLALWAVAFVRRRRRNYSIHRADERLERLAREGLYSKTDAGSPGTIEPEGRATAEGADAARSRGPEEGETDVSDETDQARPKPLGPINAGAVHRQAQDAAVVSSSDGGAQGGGAPDDGDGDSGSSSAPAAGSGTGS